MRGQTSKTFLYLFYLVTLAMIAGTLMYHATQTDTDYIHRTFRSTHLSQAITAYSFWPHQGVYDFYGQEDKQYKSWSPYQVEVQSLDVLAYKDGSIANPLRKDYASRASNQLVANRAPADVGAIRFLKGENLRERVGNVSQRSVECIGGNLSSASLHLKFGGEKEKFYDAQGYEISQEPESKLIGFKTAFFVDDEEVFLASPGRSRGALTDAQILRGIAQGSKTTYEEGQYLTTYTKDNALLTITDAEKDYIVIKAPKHHQQLACKLFNALMNDPQISVALDGGTIIPAEQFEIEFQLRQNSNLISKQDELAYHFSQHFRGER